MISFEIRVDFVNVVIEINLFGAESKVVRDLVASERLIGIVSVGNDNVESRRVGNDNVESR